MRKPKKIFKVFRYNFYKKIEVKVMQTVTLQVNDATFDKFFWLLKHFSKDEVKVLEQSKYISDDEYLRSIDGMVESIQAAREEPIQNGVTLDKLEW